ncbi:MAG: hypothetical protein PHX78_03650 [bacterium]|nr:hypothetical protein [bacterium]
MENNGQPVFSTKEIIYRLVISGLLLFIAVIGYITLLLSKELISYKILMGIILTLWSFSGNKAKGKALNLWVMRIGGISLLLTGIANYFNWIL